MARIFISYKRVDNEKVFKIKDQIEAALGEKCWIDLEGIESDAIFATKIIGAINECEIFLFMYSKVHREIKDYENDWTIRELNFAQQKKKRIVFINLDGSELTDWFILLFGTKQRVDGRSTESLSHLIADLKKWLGCCKKESLPTFTKNSTTESQLDKKQGANLSFNINGVSFDMVYVEGESFMMGATSEQGSDAFDDDEVHKVTLSDYYIGKYEVTQELWKAVMGDNPSYFKGILKGRTKPVDSVSWNDCQIFIRKLNGLLSSQLGGKRFALPTEAQWEFAARGGNKSLGYEYAGSYNLSSVAWYKNNSGRSTHKVGTKYPNELGLYDMSGNVWEWCQDWYGSYYSISQLNPAGSAIGSHRVIRGGSWDSGARYCRVSNRDGGAPSGRNRNVGFRVVCFP